MALTREEVEVILIGRVGKLLTAAGLDGATQDGTNADLTDALASAARRIGVPLASLAALTDADLSALADSDLDQYLSLAELALLEKALGNYDLVNIRVGQRSEDLSDLAARLERAIERKRALLLTLYGIGAQTLTAGVIDLGFAENGDL